MTPPRITHNPRRASIVRLVSQPLPSNDPPQEHQWFSKGFVFGVLFTATVALALRAEEWRTGAGISVALIGTVLLAFVALRLLRIPHDCGPTIALKIDDNRSQDYHPPQPPYLA